MSVQTDPLPTGQTSASSWSNAQSNLAADLERPAEQAALMNDILRMREMLARAAEEIDNAAHPGGVAVQTSVSCTSSQLQLQLLQLQFQEGDGPQWSPGSHDDAEVLGGVSLEALRRHHELISMRVNDRRA